MDVSVIIVNYNTIELTRNCLISVFEQTKDIDFEVIVSDNGSTDGSIEMIKNEFPNVVLIENKANLGFGAANNRGLKIAKGKYIFYLNSDTVLLNNAVKMFFDYWENAENKELIGALGAWLLKDNQVIHSFGDFPTCRNIFGTFFRAIRSSLFGNLKKYRKTIKKNNNPDDFKTKEIYGYITGADLFVRNDPSAIFDERYFMYFEESDLQFNNFFRKGLKRIILTEPKIVHFEGGSDKKTYKYDFKKMSAIFYWRSCLLYFRKNFPKEKLFLYTLKFLVRLIYLFPQNISNSKKMKDFCEV